MARDTSRDGFRNKIRYYVLTHFRIIWWIANHWGWLRRRINGWAIDNAVNQTSNRPYPFSTLADYTSWESLTDRTWFSRHLPAKRGNELPDANRVAELFRRPEGGPRFSQKSTLLFPSFAQWFTDGFLLTDENRRKTHSSHELDFAPLYGLKKAVTQQLRLRSDVPGRRGRLLSQTIGTEEYSPFLYQHDGIRDPRFSDVPEPLRLPQNWPEEKKKTLFAFGGERANTSPQTAMLNTLFLREHNRCCRIIETAYPAWDDERVFQTVRNVVTVLMIKLVVEEYVNHISPYHFQFKADPTRIWRSKWYRPNWFTVEFNLLYRWHSLVPDQFEWAGQKIDGAHWLMDNRPLLTTGLGRSFDYTSRQKAGEVGLFNTPGFLHHTEALSLLQGRNADLASYNDYREVMSYPRLTAFEQISSDPQIVAGLKSLYKTVDDVEFYVGLFAEDARPNAAVPALIGRMVALDAFSQAFTNPLLSEHVFNEATFSPEGMAIIASTNSLWDIVDRNVPEGAKNYLVSMNQK